MRNDSIKKRFSFKTFSIEHDGFVELTYHVAGAEEIEVLGRRVLTTKLSVSGLIPGITQTEYRDSEGALMKAALGVMEMVMEVKV